MNILDTYCQSPIDTVHIKLLCDCPEWDWETEERGSRGRKLTGFFKNMMIAWRNGELKIIGSLPKLRQKNNFYPLSTLDVTFCIKAIEEELKIDLRSAIITRVDLAANIELQQIVSDYFKCFGVYKRSHRSNIDKSTLYYKNGKKTVISIYDKLKELKTNSENKELLKSLKGNYMRFEVRYNPKNNRSIFKLDLKLYDLTNFDLNQELIEIWYKEFKAIEKQSTTEFKLNKGDQCKELMNILAKIGIDNLGGAYPALEKLENSIDFKSQRAENKTRMRKKIRELNNRNSNLVQSPLLNELDQSFLNTYRQLLSSVDEH